MVPIPGTTARFAMVLPQPDGTIYVGLTDEPVTGPVPDVPVPSEGEIDFLLGVVASAFTTPPTRADVVGAFAGLRPAARGRRRRRDRRPVAPARDPHLHHRPDDGRRRQAHDLPPDGRGHPRRPGRRRPRSTAGPCRTAALPLLGAGSAAELRGSTAPARLALRLRRFGTEADLVLSTAREVTGLSDDELLAPASDDVPVTLAELVFASPTRARTTSTTCSTGGSGWGWSPPTAPSPSRSRGARWSSSRPHAGHPPESSVTGRDRGHSAKSPGLRSEPRTGRGARWDRSPRRAPCRPHAARGAQSISGPEPHARPTTTSRRSVASTPRRARTRST